MRLKAETISALGVGILIDQREYSYEYQINSIGIIFLCFAIVIESRRGFRIRKTVAGMITMFIIMTIVAVAIVKLLVMNSFIIITAL